MNVSGRDMTVCFSVGCFFPTVMRTLFGIIGGTMGGSCGGINEKMIHTVQSRFLIFRRRQRAIRHAPETHEGIIQNWRELMQVFLGFRARHLQLRSKPIKGRIGLVVIANEQQFIGHSWPCAFATTAGFAPACAGRDPFCIRLLLDGLRAVAKDGQ
jgi:hypothetical protein